MSSKVSDSFVELNNVEDEEIALKRGSLITQEINVTYKTLFSGATKKLLKLQEENIFLEETVKGLTRRLSTIEAELTCYQTDGLTGGVARKRFDILFEQQVKSSTRVRPGESVDPCVVIMIDIDYFKKFNDTFGHLLGDAVLKFLGTIIRGVIRRSDIFGRYGGDELIIVLPNCDYIKAAAFCKEINRRIAIEEAYLLGDSDVNITLSIGMAKVEIGDVVEKILERVDKGLYVVKEKGRNGVCVWSEDGKHRFARYR